MADSKTPDHQVPLANSELNGILFGIGITLAGILLVQFITWLLKKDRV